LFEFLRRDFAARNLAILHLILPPLQPGIPDERIAVVGRIE